MCENQLISNHHFLEHLKQGLRAHDLRMPADEKDVSRMIANNRVGAISLDSCAKDWMVSLS